MRTGGVTGIAALGPEDIPVVLPRPVGTLFWAAAKILALLAGVGDKTVFRPSTPTSTCLPLADIPTLPGAGLGTLPAPGERPKVGVTLVGGAGARTLGCPGERPEGSG